MVAYIRIHYALCHATLSLRKKFIYKIIIINKKYGKT